MVIINAGLGNFNSVLSMIRKCGKGFANGANAIGAGFFLFIMVHIKQF